MNKFIAEKYILEFAAVMNLSAALLWIIAVDHPWIWILFSVLHMIGFVNNLSRLIQWHKKA